MRDDSSAGTGDDAGLLVGSKTLETLKNALESGKEKAELDAMKKIIGHIAKGIITHHLKRKPHRYYNHVAFYLTFYTFL